MNPCLTFLVSVNTLANLFERPETGTHTQSVKKVDQTHCVTGHFASLRHPWPYRFLTKLPLSS